MTSSSQFERRPAPLQIRPERPADQAAIHNVQRRAFGRSEEAVLVDRLRASCPNRLSLVAERDWAVVGHVLFTPVQIDSPAGSLQGMGLAPVGVLPEFQGQGIGGRLIEVGLEMLWAAQVPFVVVLGDPAYYSRFGFQPASRLGVACEFEGVPDGAFMIIAPHPGVLKGRPGVARYQPEFRSLA
jgi:putative acetyltransferase